jgi:hypothetical protein
MGGCCSWLRRTRPGVRDCRCCGVDELRPQTLNPRPYMHACSSAQGHRHGIPGTDRQTQGIADSGRAYSRRTGRGREEQTAGIAGMGILCMAVKYGPNVLFFVSNRTDCMLLASVMKAASHSVGTTDVLHLLSMLGTECLWRMGPVTAALGGEVKPVALSWRCELRFAVGRSRASTSGCCSATTTPSSSSAACSACWMITASTPGSHTLYPVRCICLSGSGKPGCAICVYLAPICCLRYAASAAAQPRTHPEALLMPGQADRCMVKGCTKSRLDFKLLCAK